MLNVVLKQRCLTILIHSYDYKNWTLSFLVYNPLVVKSPGELCFLFIQWQNNRRCRAPSRTKSWFRYQLSMTYMSIVETECWNSKVNVHYCIQLIQVQEVDRHLFILFHGNFCFYSNCLIFSQMLYQKWRFISSWQSALS